MNRRPIVCEILAFGIFVLALGVVQSTVSSGIDLDQVYEHDSGLVSRQRRAAEEQIRPSCLPGAVIPKTRVDTSENLRMLRKLMSEKKIDAYIVPRSDEHASEYTAKHDRRRSWISGFDGSFGDVVILKDLAILWTDGRYNLQAEQQLDCNWIFMKVAVPGTPNITTWLGDNLRETSTVGADPRLITQRLWLKYLENLMLKAINLIDVGENLIDKIWNEENGRPVPIGGALFVHDVKFAGQTWEQKIQNVRIKLYKEGADGIVISALDEVAWLLNLRGNDVPYLPVFKAYLFIARDFVRLYVDQKKVGDDVRRHLRSDGCSSRKCVSLTNYEDLWTNLRETINSLGKILVTSLSSFALYKAVDESHRVVVDSPIVIMKSVKNKVEAEGMKNAHYRDSATIIDFVSRLQEGLKKGEDWDEIKAAKELSKLRSKREYNRGESFETISAFGSNGAVIHYKPTPTTNKRIDDSGMYLLDSGGQYLDGTTDITRTFHFGQPSDFMRETYTRVLMGSIDLFRLKFPAGTTDRGVDINARRYLYEIGLDYNHGTGHGIGVFSNIHEPLLSIRKPNTRKKPNVLLPGMFMSNEPGFYEPHAFGVRLETIMTVFEAANSSYGIFYGFEAVALIPFEPNLINRDLLTKYHVDWLNNYHLTCRSVIGEMLRKEGKEMAYEWLRLRTEPIAVGDQIPVTYPPTKPVVATPRKQCPKLPNSAILSSIPNAAFVSVVLLVIMFFSS